MKHIQEGFEGTSIERWEIEHGIRRYVKDGCEYVVLEDKDKYDAACADDARRYIRQRMMEAQEQAYGGG